MKKFILNTLLFLFIVLLLVIIGLFLPTTPRTSTSLLFSENQKDSLLKNVKAPRIIFIGGSNLSYGLNSKMIKDSLEFNPINTSIHAAIGLIYMMDNALPFIKSGDIVVVAPEYQQFYETLAYGGNELLITVLDVNQSKFNLLKKDQWINIIKFIPKYAISKLSPFEYFVDIDENNFYGVNSFNKYGDSYIHWKLKKEKFAPYGSLGNNYNPSIIKNLLSFNNKLLEKGAKLFVTFPGYQASSFINSISQIRSIELELKKNNFILLGNPERYKIPDSLMFNTPYHLSKKGVDYRTNLLIFDIKKILNKAPGGNKGYM